MVIDLRGEIWFEYLDPKKPFDENGRSQLKDDAPEEVVEAYRRFIERNKDYA